jgi:hypothetical protein
VFSIVRHRHSQQKKSGQEEERNPANEGGHSQPCGLDSDLQEEINLLVRTIDRGWPCISSGVIECQFHAGHFFARSTHPALRFHLHNIWAQSAYDNGQREGNRNGYIDGLVNLYGEGYGFIEHLPRIYPSRKWAKDELIDALKVVKRCIKKVPNRRLTKEERWEYRDLFNDEIKLY